MNTVTNQVMTVTCDHRMMTDTYIDTGLQNDLPNREEGTRRYLERLRQAVEGEAFDPNEHVANHDPNRYEHVHIREVILFLDGMKGLHSGLFDCPHIQS